MLGGQDTDTHKRRMSTRYGEMIATMSRERLPPFVMYSQTMLHLSHPQMEHPESQNTAFSTELMTQNELTQLVECEEADGLLSPLPPHSPLNPQSVPWGRLIPCSRHWPGGEQRGGIDLLPREPSSRAPAEAAVSFLGLDGLKRSDVFNEYTLGRSNKCDVIVAKTPGEVDALQDWAHAMISNRHCRIFCMLKTTTASTSMDVYVEDTSGNGTLINNATLLRRGEKRILHTGDEICLVNPATLRKKIRSNEMLRDLKRHHSFIFVNVFQQQFHSMSILASVRQRQPRSGPMPPPSSKQKGIVDVRATNNHSFRRPGLLSPVSSIDAVSRTSRRVSPRRQMPRRVEEEYDIRDVLGSGTCGEVRRAIHRQTGEQLAVKVIALGGRNRANRFDETLEAEASILQALDHPYVVKLRDVFVSPGVAVYLVMELLHGGDLFDRIVQKGHYSEKESRRVMRRLFNAIYYLHEIKNVVHRDLKPENILLVSRENDIDVKLTDFGLAKLVTDDGLKTFCGTPQYFAPEVLRRRHTVAGRGRYGKQADMWSLGVILYILLSGMPPFDVSSGLDSVADAKISFPQDKWWGISEEAKDLVRKLLMADPKKRISVKDACKHKWIMTEDGDTHAYPLDDPSVSIPVESESQANKRLFACEEEGSTAHAFVTEKQPSKPGHLVDTMVIETCVKGAQEQASGPPSNSTLACSEATTPSSNPKDSAFEASQPEASTTIKPPKTPTEDTPRMPVADGTVQAGNVEMSGSQSAKTIEHAATHPTVPLPDHAKTSLNESICETRAEGSPQFPVSMNARSNHFRAEVLKSIEKAAPTASKQDPFVRLCHQLESINGDEPLRNISPEEKRSPEGILLTPKSTPVMAIIASRKSTAVGSSRPAATASEAKSKKRAPSRKVTVKVTPVESRAAELTEDEICSQFSDEGDSISSCSTTTDDGAEKKTSKARAAKRPANDAPRQKRKKRRIVLGARAPVSNQDRTAVSDKDVVPKENASASEDAGISKALTSEKENKAVKSKETSVDWKGQAGGRQTTLSNFFLKKQHKVALDEENRVTPS